MKQEPGHITDDLLVKYLLDEATQAERSEVQAWTVQSEENKRYFDHFRLIWDQSKKIEAKTTVNANEAWQRFQNRIAEESGGGKKGNAIPLSRFTNTWVRVAAVILLMAGGWVYYNYTSSNRLLAFNSNDSILTQTLPDGTVVTLNKNSSIQYPKAFKGDTREVILTGEAFFDVAHDKTHPFIITADDASIKVVGTSFNVKSNADRTEVIVETGIVEVSKQQHGIRVTPKQKAIVLKTKTEPYKETVNDELYNYYRTREFICNATPLYRLVDVLNEVYHANIMIADDRIKNLPLTTTFHDQSLDSILNVIEGTFNIKVERDGNRIILK